MKPLVTMTLAEYAAALERSIPKTKYYVRIAPADGGPFETIYPIETTDLEIPKMIDLEATSS